MGSEAVHVCVHLIALLVATLSWVRLTELQGKTTLRLDTINQVLALFGRRMEPVAFKLERDDAER